jgi:hypothetical protein
MIKHPHGVWIWELAKVNPNYLQRLKQQSCQRVYLKVFDGRSRSMFWAHQCSKVLILISCTWKFECQFLD